MARVDEQPVAWVANRGGVTLLRFDQAHTRLDLHAGSAEPAGGSWHYGGDISATEIHRVVAAFNGGFKLSYGSVGFVAGHHIAVPLSEGLGSIVTYADGRTQIGSWLLGVPARSRPITSVLQNLSLMIDHGAPAASVEACTSCWGATLGGGSAVARSALGITAGGQLVWAGGEDLTPAGIAAAMVTAGVQRAVELDINPEWVAGYLYVHRAAGPSRCRSFRASPASRVSCLRPTAATSSRSSRGDCAARRAVRSSAGRSTKSDRDAVRPIGKPRVRGAFP